MDNSRLLSIMGDMLEELHAGICITDGQGIILRIGKSCESLYGIKSCYEGKHVSVLEEEGVFSPSLTMIALKERKKVAMTQPDKFGHQLLVTATPIFDPDTNEILYVISYASWDSTNVVELQEHYNQLQKEIKRSNLELDTLKRMLLQADIVAHSPKMLQIKHLVQRIADVDVQILITGEAGCGKSNMAKYIHKNSNRRNQPFGQMNCSAFSGTILEDELFGYVKINPKNGEEIEKIGLCEILDTGTLFLEDIENMSRSTQASLLYLLKNKCYYKRNSKEAKHVDIQIIASSRKSSESLSKELADGLFYSLSVVCVNMPSLKERKEDIPFFVQMFLSQFNEKYQRDAGISAQAAELLKMYHWPGNITELKYVIQQLILTVEEDTIQSYHLPDQISPFSNARFSANVDLREYMEYYEGRLILQAYEKCKTTVKLAKYLGISQASAVRKLQKYLDKARSAEETAIQK
ncbi:MAG: sigma 54-interacting transcriptional regulator [Bacillota bacterium]